MAVKQAASSLPESSSSIPSEPKQKAPPLTREAALKVLQQAFYEAQRSGLEFLIANGADPRNPGDPTPAPALHLSLIGVQIDDSGALVMI